MESDSPQPAWPFPAREPAAHPAPRPQPPQPSMPVGVRLVVDGKGAWLDCPCASCHLARHGWLAPSPEG